MPVAVTETVVLCPCVIERLTGWAVIAGALQTAAVTVTVADALSRLGAPHPLVTRTQYEVVVEGLTLIDGPGPMGEEMFPTAPLYH